jgi:hypothetical protein
MLRIFSDLYHKLVTRRLRKSSGLPPFDHTIPPEIACFDCGIKHQLPSGFKQALASAENFCDKHPEHAVNWLEVPGYAGLWTPNADVKLALQALQSFTVTNLQGLSSSATAGWQSAVVDNTSNLFLDALVVPNLAFTNNVPGSDKACYIYAYGGIESGTYSYPATGSEGTITLSDITANPTNVKRIGKLGYLAQGATIAAGPFSVATGFGAVLPPYWGIVIMNYSGVALQSSGNTVKYRGVYMTVI